MWSALLAKWDDGWHYCRIERRAADSFEVWTGVPGTHGSSRTVQLGPGDDALALMHTEARLAMANGFERAFPRRLHVTHPTAGDRPSVEELEQRDACVRALAAVLQPAGFARLAGTDAADGSWAANFVSVVEPIRIREVVDATLRDLGVDRAVVEVTDADLTSDPFFDED